MVQGLFLFTPLPHPSPSRLVPFSPHLPDEETEAQGSLWPERRQVGAEGTVSPSRATVLTTSLYPMRFEELFQLPTQRNGCRAGSTYERQSRGPGLGSVGGRHSGPSRLDRDPGPVLCTGCVTLAGVRCLGIKYEDLIQSGVRSALHMDWPLRRCPANVRITIIVTACVASSSRVRA